MLILSLTHSIQHSQLKSQSFEQLDESQCSQLHSSILRPFLHPLKPSKRRVHMQNYEYFIHPSMLAGVALGGKIFRRERDKGERKYHILEKSSH